MMAAVQYCIVGNIGGANIWRNIKSFKYAGSNNGTILVFGYQRQLSQVAVATCDNCR